MGWNMSSRPARRCSFSPGWTGIKRSHSISPKMWWCSGLAHSFGLAQGPSKVREGFGAPLLGSVQREEPRSASWGGECWVGESTNDLCWGSDWMKSFVSKAEFLPPFFMASKVLISFMKRWCGRVHLAPDQKLIYVVVEIKLLVIPSMGVHASSKALLVVWYEVHGPRDSDPNTRWDGRWVQTGLIWCLLGLPCLPVLFPFGNFFSSLTLLSLFLCPMLSK